MNYSINKKYTDNQKADILDLIFFLKKMHHVKVDFHNDDEFIIIFDHSHHHISFWMSSGDDIIKDLKEYIIEVDEYNKDKVHVVTHEDLKIANKSSADFLIEESKYPVRSIVSKEHLENYNNIITQFKKDIQEQYSKQENKDV